ncbi:MAG: thiamine pyrophosphate-dependent enzyme [Tannerellaceae bacterium]
MSKHAGDLIKDILLASKVDRIWGITGDSANFITEAVCKSSIRFIHVRHEETAGFACGGEALMKDELSVCIGSCGPGALHLINGLYDANRNGAPVLCLATHIPKDEIGTQYVQETDPMKLFADCSVFCEYVQSVEQLPRMMGIAMQTAVAHKGVAVIIIPGDISSKTLVSEAKVQKYVPHYCCPVIKPVEAEIKQLADILNAATKITIIGGQGCRYARSEVKELSRILKAPLGWSYRSKEYLDHNNPLAIGCVGKFGNSSTDEAIEKCEVLLLLGVGNAGGHIYNTNAKIIQIDVNGSAIGRRHWIDYGYKGEVQDTIYELLSYLKEKFDTTFAKEVCQCYKDKQKQYAANSEKKTTEEGKIMPEYLISLIDEKAPFNTCFCADTGTPLILMERYISSGDKRRFFHSAEYGSIGNALPTSMGVRSATVDRKVVALCGDGGLSMLLGDLLTIVQEKFDVKMIVFNNATYDLAAMNTMVRGKTPINTALTTTDFAKVATSLGIRARRVEHVEELAEALDELLNSTEAYLLDVRVAAVSELHQCLLNKNKNL